MKKFLTIFLIYNFHFATAQNARFLIPYREGNKWGFCDTLGKVVIAPKYRATKFFLYNDNTANPLAQALIDDSTFTFIDSLGKKVLPIFANKKVTTQFVDDKIHFRIQDLRTLKLGLFIDNKLIAEPIFDDINSTNTYNNCIWVKQKNKQGLLNEKGEIIIPIQFDRVTVSYYLTTEKNIVWFGIKGNSKTKFEQKTSERFNYELFKKNCLSSYFRDDEERDKYFKQLEEERKKNTTINLKNPNEKSPDLLGVVDTVKHLTRYDSLVLLKDSLKKAFTLDSIQNIDNKRKFYYVEKSGKQGIIDDSLKIFLMNNKYNIKQIYLNSTVSWLYTENQSLALFVYEKNGKFGITNEFDDTILAPIYEAINWDNSCNGFKYYKNHKQGLFMPNTYYKPIKPKYNVLESRGNNYYETLKFRVNSKWSFVLFQAYMSSKDNSSTKNSSNIFLGYVGENGIEYFKN